MFDAGTSTQGAAHLWDLARHLLLPAFVLAAHELAVLVRVTRGALAHEMTVEHVRTARGKGISESGVLMRHTLPRALLPVITVVGGRAGQLVTGAVVVELVFGWPGIGRLLLAALQSRDIPVLLGIFMLVSVSVVVVNLITDLVYAARDPRVELAQAFGRDVDRRARVAICIRCIDQIAVWINRCGVSRHCCGNGYVWTDHDVGRSVFNRWPATLLAPSTRHAFGTDALGRECSVACSLVRAPPC